MEVPTTKNYYSIDYSKSLEVDTQPREVGTVTKKPPKGTTRRITMSTWEQIRKANKARGMKPNGLYNKPKKSPLSDTPPVGEALKEVIQDYIRDYKSTKGERPTTAHLNNKYSIRATSNFYKGL